MFYVPLPYKCTKLNNKCTTKAIFTHIWHLWSVTFGPWERQNSIKCPELLNSTHWVIKIYIGKRKKTSNEIWEKLSRWVLYNWGTSTNSTYWIRNRLCNMLVLLCGLGEIMDNVMQCLFTEKTRQEEMTWGRHEISVEIWNKRENVVRKTIENCQKQGLAQKGNTRLAV